MSWKDWALPIAGAAGLALGTLATGGADIPILGAMGAGALEEGGAAAIPLIGRFFTRAALKKAIPIGAALLGGKYLASKWGSKPPAQQAEQSILSQLGSTTAQPRPKIDPITSALFDALNTTLQKYGDQMTLGQINDLFNTAINLMSTLSQVRYQQAMAGTGNIRAMAAMLKAQQNPMLSLPSMPLPSQGGALPTLPSYGG